MTARDTPSSRWGHHTRERRWKRRARVFEATLTLAAMALILHILPSRYVTRHLLGKALGVETPLAEPRTPPSSVIVATSRAIHRADALLPFPTLCLAQAMAGRAMLRRRGETVLIHLSVRMTNNGQNAAHAWLTCHGHVVVGLGRPSDQVEIARFESAALR